MLLLTLAPEAGGVKRALPTLAPNVVSEAYVSLFSKIRNEDKDNFEEKSKDGSHSNDEIRDDVERK